MQVKTTLSEEKAQLEQKLTAIKQEIEQLQVEKVCNSMNVSAEKITLLCRVVFPGMINNNSTQFFYTATKKAMMEACTTTRLHRRILALIVLLLY